MVPALEFKSRMGDPSRPLMMSGKRQIAAPLVGSLKTISRNLGWLAKNRIHQRNFPKTSRGCALSASNTMLIRPRQDPRLSQVDNISLFFGVRLIVG
jgi:hypothetical protein